MRAGAGEFHFGVPSLRLILASAFFRAVDFFTATMIAIAIVTMIAAPMIAIVWLVKFILQYLQVCTP